MDPVSWTVGIVLAIWAAFGVRSAQTVPLRAKHKPNIARCSEHGQGASAGLDQPQIAQNNRSK